MLKKPVQILCVGKKTHNSSFYDAKLRFALLSSLCSAIFLNISIQIIGCFNRKGRDKFLQKISVCLKSARVVTLSYFLEPFLRKAQERSSFSKVAKVNKCHLPSKSPLCAFPSFARLKKSSLTSKSFRSIFVSRFLKEKR